MEIPAKNCGGVTLPMTERIACLLCTLLLFVSTTPAQGAGSDAAVLKAAREAAFGFLSAGSYSAMEQYLPDQTRAELREIDPEILDQVLAGRLMVGLRYNVSSVEPVAEPRPGIRLRFSSNSWLEFQVQDEHLRSTGAQVDLSVKYVRDGSEVSESPFASRLVLDMAQENGTWRVQRLVVTGPFNLFDKFVLDNLRRSNIARNQASAVGSIRSLNLAEFSFAEENPTLGFTCYFQALAASPLTHVPREEASSLRSTVLKDGTRSGYRFAVGGCGAGKAYQVSAEPIRPGKSGVMSYCSDQSGVIYVSSSGSGETCLKEKNPI